MTSPPAHLLLDSGGTFTLPVYVNSDATVCDFL